ncbi:MAG TPA: hypothetical protein VHM01_21585 [Alphaproteobacteria bacterium]|nr:hypothetical protein [Alphaproteobacteria bacterium]
MDSFVPVIDTYDTARAAGLSRADAFARAIDAFRAQRPDLSIGEAGREVTRILLRAAAAAQGDGRTEAFPRPAISW